MLSSTQTDILNKALPAGQQVGLGDQIRMAQGLYGKAFFLDCVNGNDSYDGSSPEKAFKTIAVAYAALTENKNEVLYVMGGATSIQVTAAFTWAKSYTHMVGVSAGGPYGRSRFGHTGTGHVVTLFTITANGCIFKNIHWQMGNGHAENLNCVLLSATTNYCYFENCHFDAPLNATEGAAAYCCLYMTALSRSNSFKGCWFGDWTAAPSSTDGTLINFLGTNAGTQFEDCVFLINTTQATMVAITAAVDIGGGNAPGYLWFRNCDFIAGATGVNAAFTAPTTGKIVISKCRGFGVAEWCADASANVMIACGPAEEANGQGGIGVAQGS
jgi:hypothetical protein